MQTYPLPSTEKVTAFQLTGKSQLCVTAGQQTNFPAQKGNQYSVILYIN